jgi:hypothetical protein
VRLASKFAKRTNMTKIKKGLKNAEVRADFKYLNMSKKSEESAYFHQGFVKRNFFHMDFFSFFNGFEISKQFSFFTRFELLQQFFLLIQAVFRNFQGK